MREEINRLRAHAVAKEIDGPLGGPVRHQRLFVSAAKTRVAVLPGMRLAVIHAGASEFGEKIGCTVPSAGKWPGACCVKLKAFGGDEVLEIVDDTRVWHGMPQGGLLAVVKQAANVDIGKHFLIAGALHGRDAGYAKENMRNKCGESC